MIGTVYSEIRTGPRGGLSASSTMVPNGESLDALTWNSGGYLIEEDTKNPVKEYKLTSDHLNELQKKGWRMYVAALEVYRVQVKLSTALTQPIEWHLDLSEAVRKRIPLAKTLYLRRLLPCQ